MKFNKVIYRTQINAEYAEFFFFFFPFYQCVAVNNISFGIFTN